MKLAVLIIRRSTAPLAALLIAATAVWLSFAAVRPGFNLWSDLVTGLSTSSVYTGCIAAGVAAYESGRWTDAHRERVRFSRRTALHARFTHAAATITPLLAGYGVALLCVTLLAGARGFYGGPNPWWLLSVAAALLIAAALGYGIGVVAGARWWVAPVAAVGFFACYIAFRSTTAPYGVISLFPVVTNADSEFVTYVTPTMVGQTAAWCGATVIIIALAGRWTHASRGATAAVLVIAATSVFAGAATVIGTNGQYTTGFNSRDFVCNGDGVVACLNPGYLPAMTPLLSAMSQLNERAAGTPLEAKLLEQNVEGIGDEPAPGARSVYLEQFANADDIHFAVYRYVIKYGGMQTCMRGGADPSAFSAVAAVDAWLSGFDDDVQSAGWAGGLRRLQSLSPTEGRAWFEQNSDEYFGCTLQPDSLP